MKPTSGPAPIIIAQALALGIFCRPVSWGPSGEALEPTRDLFFHVFSVEMPSQTYSVSPAELLGDWELTTADLLRREYEEDGRDPF